MIFELFQSLFLRVFFFLHPFPDGEADICSLDINREIIGRVLVSRMSSGLRLTWILVIGFILILENPVLAAPGSKRARPNCKYIFLSYLICLKGWFFVSVNWNDAIIRVNFAGSGYGNAPGMHKRSDLMSDNSNMRDNNMMEMVLVPASSILEMRENSK